MALDRNQLQQRNQQRQQQQGQSFGQSFAHPTVNSWGPSYDPPMEGSVSGQIVSIISDVDLQGMSPGYKVIDDAGQTFFLPVEEVIVTDRRALPNPTASALRVATERQQGQQAYQLQR
jgi:hypothetical protein